MMQYGDGYGYGYGLFDLVSHVLWAVLIFALIIFGIRLIFGRRRHHWCHMLHADSALEILKERYAKGEIQKAEFEEKKKDLHA